MKSINLDIRNYNTDVPIQDHDILCIEELRYKQITIACSFLTVEIIDGTQSYRVKIKFEWRDSIYELDESDFLFIAETNMLFFRSTYQWVVIDMENKILKRREHAFYLPFISKENNFVLIHDELYAESTKYNGDKIDNVPIDPPYEMQEYEDRIEYTSIIFGHQILKTR